MRQMFRIKLAAVFCLLVLAAMGTGEAAFGEECGQVVVRCYTGETVTVASDTFVGSIKVDGCPNDPGNYPKCKPCLANNMCNYLPNCNSKFGAACGGMCNAKWQGKKCGKNQY